MHQALALCKIDENDEIEASANMLIENKYFIHKFHKISMALETGPKHKWKDLKIKDISCIF